VVEARPSASVILVRDMPTGLETFMVRRHAQSPSFASAYVFPGGTVRDDDRSFSVAEADALAQALSSRSDSPVDAAYAAAMYVCAVRELFEEAGVLLVEDFEVAPDDTELQERTESLRLSLQAGQLSLKQVMKANAWQPAFDRLVPFSHWITPRAIARRFDTRFFVAEMPRGQLALHDTIESTDGVWLTPMAALSDAYHTVYATAQHLKRIAQFETVAALVEFARRKTIRMVSPEVNEHAEGLRVFIRPEIADSW
jgi:8-oxo-dGTP pyrophosphatase MutT (NUDIX family)